MSPSVAAEFVSASTSWQSACAMSRVQRRAAAHRVEAHRDNPRHPRRHQHRGEERRILQQHADVRRPVRVESLAQRGGERGAVPDVVAPADERVLEVDTAVVDVDQRDQQIGDGR